MASGDASSSVDLDVDGRPVTVTRPDKVFFTACGATKLDLVDYYLSVGEAALQCVRDRPMVLKRYPGGVGGSWFFQKRVPAKRPEWLQSVVVHFPSGRTAEELCPADLAHLVWAVNLGCIDLNPWAVRRNDLDHPDELRVDLDPQPGVDFAAVRQVTLLVRELLDDHGLAGFPKTSGSRGMHVVVPIVPRYGFTDVRRAALALARRLERRRPDLATAAWWKLDRGSRVFVDYNQNARDRTVASAYSVRPRPAATVSCPLAWEEVAQVEPRDLTLATVPERFRTLGDPGAGIDDHRGRLDHLLERA
ncbi:MAG: non-homologous end-joining DNA ligase, partial [Acidimicrobiales bacterium]